MLYLRHIVGMGSVFNWLPVYADGKRTMCMTVAIR